MSIDRIQRVKDYLQLISSGGVEEMLSTAEAAQPAPTLESTGGTEVMEVVDKHLDKALEGLRNLARGNDIPLDQLVDIEAIIIPDKRPVFDIRNNTLLAPQGLLSGAEQLWTKLVTDAALRPRIETVLSSIGRVELPGQTAIPYGGTGFVIGDGLLMTNRHVAEIFARGLGTLARFIPGRRAGIDFRRDTDAGTVFEVVSVQMIHPFWDMALLKVDGLPATAAPLTLALDDARDLKGTEVVVVGYPAFDGRNPGDVQDDLLHRRYQFKRLQPGQLQGNFETNSFGKMVPAGTHDCSTLGGNSGSPVINLENGQVVGLHFAGRYLERNYLVPSSALSRDSRFVDSGAKFSGTPPGDPNEWRKWWISADEGESVGTSTIAKGGATASQGYQQGVSAATGSAVIVGNGSTDIEIPIRISVSLGAVTARAPRVEIGTEAMAAEEAPAPGGAVVPKMPGDYIGRTGYDELFLSRGTQLPPIAVPMPGALDPKVLAPTKLGDHKLDYQNFSLMMHAKRRLALVVASNVTEEHKLRKPEAGRDYSRKGLFNERWFPDARLDENYQLPDVFFSKDSGAFDKGHVARRDDVAWGPTFELLLKGNVDSFHVTNCSPQLARYNRSDEGVDNWGDLENHVLAEAATERLCVFAGPVLSEDDRVFVGAGPKNTIIRARIPTRFWKTVVARVADGNGLAAFGFMLEQDLSDVPLEFAVSDEFIKSLYPLEEISRLTGVRFDPVLIAADQFNELRGLEVAMRAGAKSGKVKNLKR
ncbi:DNA/RNA non-specific endonuclease [Rhizobium leguminosarum]|uniref:DNA/RNA non-specific endonuclease n=1 Tax=Rhizobium TaxID=379 RepID=UPI00140FF28F|nr:DNA/RNA non-specific endonuclease [Rhizobium leguminosarum]QIO66046.1 trypsin-like serine protease [Rhizobium leguminosarum bv. trifolii]